MRYLFISRSCFSDVIVSLLAGNLPQICPAVSGFKKGFEHFEGQNATLSTGSADTNEPPRGKTNNVVSEQVRHKPACKSTEKKLEA